METTCANPECPVYGTTYIQMTTTDGSCGLCGKMPPATEAKPKCEQACAEIRGMKE